MVNVIQPQKWTGEKNSESCKSKIFHVACHTATIDDISGCGAFPTQNGHRLRLFGPYTRNISVMQCEMAGNVMESKGSELEW